MNSYDLPLLAVQRATPLGAQELAYVLHDLHRQWDASLIPNLMSRPTTATEEQQFTTSIRGEHTHAPGEEPR